TFKKYKKKADDNGDAGNGGGDKKKPAADSLTRLTIHCANPEKARDAFEARRAVAEGVYFARDLVNEPANVLGPVEFAERVKELERVGLDVEILDEEALKALGMNTLLAVSVGSARPGCVAVMQWNGAKSK